MIEMTRDNISIDPCLDVDNNWNPPCIVATSNSCLRRMRNSEHTPAIATMHGSICMIVIGNPLILSQDFPPLHTVHATFIAHGVPSIAIGLCLNNQTLCQQYVLSFQHERHQVDKLTTFFALCI